VLVAVVAGGLLGSALAGCGSGQDAPTAQTLASIPGVSADAAGVGVRNARIPFNPAGYPAGSEARVELSIVNYGTTPVQLLDLSSPAAESVTLVGAVQVDPAGETGGPPNGGVGPLLLLPPEQLVEVTLQVSGLADELDGTVSLPVTLTFDNGAAFALEVPVAPPAEPLPREPMDLEGEGH
jgi:copper(I)-binding protein